MELLRRPNPTSTPFWLWEGWKDFRTGRKTEPNSMQVVLQVTQEAREEGTSGRSSGGEEALEALPFQAASTSSPGGCGPFLPAEEAPGLQARGPPSPPVLPAGRSALTTAPRCLRGAGTASTSPPRRSVSRGSKGESRGPPSPPRRPVTPRPSPSRQQAVRRSSPTRAHCRRGGHVVWAGPSGRGRAEG